MKGLSKLFKKNTLLPNEGAKSQEGFSGWSKCPKCQHMLFEKQIQEHLYCCTQCMHHFVLSAQERIRLLSDKDTFVELFTELKPCDPLEFEDTEKYADRLQRAQKKLQREEGFYAGTCYLKEKKIALGVMDFGFMGGSMGSVVGEKIARLIEHAITHQLPLVIVSASGGARMQESCLSLMQMAKTAAALARLDQHRLPYISILTHPTTGGVTASFATLGDVIIAEPDALIGFAGPRVVEQTIRQKLPPKAQKSEFLLEKGMVDVICPRHQLKEKVAFFLEAFDKALDQKPPFSDTIHSLLDVAASHVS
jgi:acetyl-CoA carboxylase carboxyl transferase subunit beta